MARSGLRSVDPIGNGWPSLVMLSFKSAGRRWRRSRRKSAYIGKGLDAEIVLLSVVAPRLGPLFWRERKHKDLLQAGYTITREAQGKMERLDVKLIEQVVLAADAAEAVLAELERQPYDLVVLGGVVRSSEGGISLGSTVERLLKAVKLPRVLLVSRNTETSAG